MTATFKATPASGYAPLTLCTNLPPNDPLDVLEGAAAAKWTALCQRAADLHASGIRFEDVQELSHAKIRHQERIAHLMRPRAEGGFNLDEHAPQVVDEKRKLERTERKFTRARELKEIRDARWGATKQLETRVRDWLLAGGIPGGCTLEAVEDAPVSELLKKGESVADAVERYRHRLRELTADAHRVCSSPWPSSAIKAQAKAQVERKFGQSPSLHQLVQVSSVEEVPTLTV